MKKIWVITIAAVLAIVLVLVLVFALVKPGSNDQSEHQHTPEAEDGDCTTAIKCTLCGAITTEAKEAHVFDNACDAKCNNESCTHTRTTAHNPNEDDGDCTTAVTCSVCGEVTTPANASHTGGTATCQAKAVCSVCNKEYGDLGGHDYDETVWGYKTADGHAHLCSVADCDAHSEVVAHTSSGAATETTPEKCTVCEYIINPATGHTTHTPKDSWSHNATHHWHECEGCEDQELDKAEHSYDNACDTTCNVCGYERTITHSYTELKHDSSKHWYECSVCHALKPNSTGSHKGGSATCTDKAECSVCGAEYGRLASHTPSADDGDCTTPIKCSACGRVTTAAKTHRFDNACDTDCNNAGCEYTRTTTHTPSADDGDCTTPIKCSSCGAITTAAKTHTYDNTCDTSCNNAGCEHTRAITHTPRADDGDCTTPIKCSVCEAITTEAKTHDYDNACDTTCNHAGCTAGNRVTSHSPETDDGDCTTAIHCSVCDAITTEARASHTGGTATCQRKAKCEICNTEYGTLAGHDLTNHPADPAKCTVNGTIEYWSCSVCAKNFTDAAGEHETDDITDYAPGHEYGTTPTWEWTGYTSAKATFTCIHDNTHTETVTAIITNKVTAPATCVGEGTKEYTASVSFEGDTYTDVKKEALSVDANNHANLTVSGNASDCEGGTKKYRCKSCKKTWEETLTAEGHNYVNGVCDKCQDDEPTNDFAADYKINDDDTVTVTVKLSGVVKVAGFNITITYDPNVLYLDSTQQGDFPVTENTGTEGKVVLVHTNSTSTKTSGVVLTMTFAIDSFEDTEIGLQINEIKETWYDNSIHDTSSSVTSTKIELEQ